MSDTDIVERLFRLERSYPFTDVAHMLAEAGTEIRRLRSGRAAVIEEAEAAKEVLKIIFVPETEASLRVALERYLAARELK